MNTFAQLSLAIVQALLLLAFAPLMTGVSRVLRAKMHSRRGPPLLQDYRDIVKLMKRQDLAPADSGPVFRIMPWVLLAIMILLAMALPVFTQHSPLGAVADLITFTYLFALARFFFSLSGLDSGSSFAGIGSGREVTLAVLVEPTMILSLVVVALIEGTTSLGSISASIAAGQLQSPTAILLAGAAFAFAVFIEMGKLPFDMAEAEQELQEGPLTEYSGVSLAMLKLGLGLKKLVLAQFFLGVFLPFGSATTLDWPALLLAFVLTPLKLLLVFVIAALLENGMARGRFMLISRVTWVGFGIASLSFVFYLAGL